MLAVKIFLIFKIINETSSKSLCHSVCRRKLSLEGRSISTARYTLPCAFQKFVLGAPSHFIASMKESPTFIQVHLRNPSEGQDYRSNLVISSTREFLARINLPTWSSSAVRKLEACLWFRYFQEHNVGCVVIYFTGLHFWILFRFLGRWLRDNLLPLQARMWHNGWHITQGWPRCSSLPCWPQWFCQRWSTAQVD